MTSAVQVAWKKFACYFDVEPRYVNITKDRLCITPEEALKHVDEHTIGVVCVLGLTYTGHYEDVKAMNDALVKLNKEKGWIVGIHVDAATGGFIAPFLYPELEWDFRLPTVQSINVSGHKYGFVYPGVGWVVFRDEQALPEELLFDLSYLGGTEKTFTLNFSKSASHLMLQYYNFLRLGKRGFTEILLECQMIEGYLAEKINSLGKFDILSDNKSVPLIVFKLKNNNGYTVFDIEQRLKMDQWIVPAYKLAEDAEEINVLRIVIRETFSLDMADHLFHSIARAVEELEERAEAVIKSAIEFHEKFANDEKGSKIEEKISHHHQALKEHSVKKAKKRRGNEVRAGHGVC
jgi:glutamate decarboxylase